MDITSEKIYRILYLTPLRFKKMILSFLRRRCPHALPVFLVGIQRSGTNMLLDVLERSPDTLIYNESNRHAFKNYRIRDHKRRYSLIRKSKQPVVIFKPLNDTQNIDKLITEHSNCRVLWVYRNYEDVVNSATRRWKHFAIDSYRVAVRDDKWDTMFVARIGKENRRKIKKYLKKDLDSSSAWALTWYLRNNFFFKYGMNTIPEKVLLVKYETLVKNPQAQFKIIFDFLGLKFKSSYIERVFDSSVDKGSFEKNNSEIRLQCEQIMKRFDDVREAQ